MNGTGGATWFETALSRLLTMRVEQHSRALYSHANTKTKPRPEGTPGGVWVRSYLAHIRLRGARTNRSGYW